MRCRKTTSILFSLIFVFCLQLQAQQPTSQERLEQMNYAFMLQLEEKGLEIGLELITEHENSEIGEKALYDIANYFFSKSLLMEDNNYALARSYFIYRDYLNKYPDGNYASHVRRRMSTIIESVQYVMAAVENYEEYIIEWDLVRRKLDVAGIFSDSLNQSEFQTLDGLVSLYQNTQGSRTKIYNEITNEIISIHSQFELIGYYSKIHTIMENLDKDFGPIRNENENIAQLLSENKARVKYNDVESIIQGLYDKIYRPSRYRVTYTERSKLVTVSLQGNNVSSETFSLEQAINKVAGPQSINTNIKRVYGYLIYLSKAYSNNDTVNDLHLFFIHKFMEKNGNGEFGFMTRYHLEYIIQNSEDEGGYVYLMAKEFVENNSFISPPGEFENPFLVDG